MTVKLWYPYRAPPETITAGLVWGSCLGLRLWPLWLIVGPVL